MKNTHKEFPDGRTEKQIKLDVERDSIYQCFDRLSLVGYRSKNAVIRAVCNELNMKSGKVWCALRARAKMSDKTTNSN